MTCLGVLDRGERGDDNETSLKEGGGIKMSTTVLHSRAALSLEYLPDLCLDPCLDLYFPFPYLDYYRYCSYYHRCHVFQEQCSKVVTQKNKIVKIEIVSIH